MSFKEIYRGEVLQSRRDRSRRAFFWGRIVGLALMLTIGATLRSEPELRRALASVGMDAVMWVAGRARPAPSAQSAAPASEDAPLPKSRIKVNRFGGTRASQDQAPDAHALSQELGRTLAAQGIKN